MTTARQARQLPLFDDQEPAYSIAKISGEVSRPLGSDPLDYDSQVFVILRARVAGVTHKDDVDGHLVRSESLKVTSSVVLPAGEGLDLLARYRATEKALLDEIFGTPALDSEPEATDGEPYDQGDEPVDPDATISEADLKALGDLKASDFEMKDPETPTTSIVDYDLPDGWTRREDGTLADPDGTIHPSDFFTDESDGEDA